MHYIYCITNKINNKSYVGQAKNSAEKRWQDHITAAYSSKVYVKKYAFQNAIVKYGKNNFVWQIIEEVETIDESNEAEEFYIAYFNTRSPNGYNIQNGGQNKNVSENTKKKLSEIFKIRGYFIGKRGVAHPNFGKKFSDARKKQQSIILSGDSAPSKKINSIIAREIYEKYLNNINITAKSLAKEYNLGHSTICNILHKKSWKKALEDLPNVNIKERTQGENWVNAKLKTQDVIDIRAKYATNKYTYQELSDEYEINKIAIYNIVVKKRWKHIK